MPINTAYFGFEVSDLDAWEAYGELVGLGIDRNAEGLFFRMDDKERRLHLIEGPSDDIAWVGWEADTAESYQKLRDHLESIGLPTLDGDAKSAELRGVDQYYYFSDPRGLRFEIALGIKEGAAFVSDKLESGFLTGNLGIGHVAFNSTDHKADEKFLREALFAQLSDYIYQPMPDGSMMHASFLHTNPRHHSVAYAEGLGDASFLSHFEIEMNNIVDVGKTYERMLAAGVAMGITLGQHSNDRVVSFYAQTPSKFMMEIGSNGILIEDEESWEPVIHERISEWGHAFQAP